MSNQLTATLSQTLGQEKWKMERGAGELRERDILPSVPAQCPNHRLKPLPRKHPEATATG